MENSKKRKLSGTILAGTFAVPAALHAAQQNITSANLFTDVCSSASSFFTKKAGESTFSFLFSRFVTCIGVVVVAIGLYGLYKYLFPNENGGNNSKEENIENNKIKKEDNLDGVQEKTAREILRSVWQEKERYIKEVIGEFIEQLQIKNKKEKLVNIIFEQLDINKIKERNINIESMLHKSKEKAHQEAVGIVKNKIRETYSEEIKKLINSTMATKIQAVYRDYIYRKNIKKINDVYEKNKEFLDNFKISEDPALSFGITFDKDVEKNENNGNRVDVSVKKEKDTIKVTFKRGKEEKTLDVAKTTGGLKDLNSLVELSKQYLKSEIKSLYLGNSKERILENFEIDEEKAKEFVEFKEKNEKNKVSVTSKNKEEKITFTFKNENEEKTLEIPVTKEGYTKLEKLIELAKDYDNKKAEEEKKKSSNLDIIDNENIIIEGKVSNCVNNQVKDENLEQFEKFKEEFCTKFNDEVKKNDPRNYLTLEEKNDKIEVVYTSNAWYKYPLYISYNSNRKVFELHYEWTTWWGKQIYENETVGSSEKAISWFLEKFQSMYRYTTGINTIFYYDNGELVLLDGDKKMSLENSDMKITGND